MRVEARGIRGMTCAVVAIAPLIAGCGVAFGAGGGVHYIDGFGDGYYDAAPHEAGVHAGHYHGARYDRAHARRIDYRRLPVPRGHLPSRGRCRVWLPGVSPGQQPRQGSCAGLRGRVPPGAWLLTRPARDPGVVELIAIDDRRPRVRVRYLYDVRSGRRLVY